jgi:hypothetical protein
VEPDHDVDGASLAGRLAEQVARLADRLRSLSDVRLSQALPDGGSRADAAHRLAQQLADAAAGLAGDPVRPVPRLDDLAVGDQVAVTGADLVAELRRAAGGAAGGAADGRWQPVGEVALAAVRLVRDQV